MTTGHDGNANVSTPSSAPATSQNTPATPGNTSGAPGSAPATSSSAGPALATLNDFMKLQFRVATVLEARPHSNADKLLVLQIDVGGEKRQICAGIKQHYTPEQLVGKQIVVVYNLEPKPLRGEMSQGMLLAATDQASGRVIILSPSEPVAAGSVVK